MTAEFRSLAEGWRDIRAMTDERVAEQVRKDGIDILVDLSLHTAGNRLQVFARKPAPVQVTFAGYPGSTGLKARSRLSIDQVKWIRREEEEGIIPRSRFIWIVFGVMKRRGDELGVNGLRHWRRFRYLRLLE